MECKHCGNTKARRLIAPLEGGLFCDECYDERPRPIGWTKTMHGNKYDRKQSEADFQHIVTRTIDPKDGKSKAAPKWR